MAVDLAFDFKVGDLAIAPNKDLDRKTGSDLVEQRIRVRLKIIQGSWLLDPTGGSLGSRLIDALRLPMFRAVTEIPLIVQEALEPMDDINVTNVVAAPNEDDSSSVDLTIYYSILDDSGQTTEEQLTTSVTIAG
jgi:hypothetical protein